MFTSHGRYHSPSNVFLEVNKWIHITIIYDPTSATGDFSGNKIYVQNTMYQMVRSNGRDYPTGPRKIVLGKILVNQDTHYTNILVDDLKMWNRKLTQEEIFENGN